MACGHVNQVMSGKIYGLMAPESPDVHTYIVHIEIRCVDCGKPFGFKGVPVGASTEGTRTDVSATELRVALLSPTELELAGLRSAPTDTEDDGR